MYYYCYCTTTNITTVGVGGYHGLPKRGARQHQATPYDTYTQYSPSKGANISHLFIQSKISWEVGMMFLHTHLFRSPTNHQNQFAYPAEARAKVCF